MNRQRGIEQRRLGSDLRALRHTLELSLWGRDLMKVVYDCVLWL